MLTITGKHPTAYERDRRRDRNKYGSYYEPREFDTPAIRWTDLEDVLALVVNGKRPNASFSDDECAVYEIVCRAFN